MELDFNQIIMGVGVGLFAIAMLVLWFSGFHVEEGHAAVLTRFGSAIRDREEKNANQKSINTKSSNEKNSNDKNKIDFVEDPKIKIYPPGFYWKWPWDKARTFSTMERVLDLSGPERGRHAMAADGTVLRLDSKIRFYPLKEQYYSYLFELKNPMGHIKEMFTCLLRNEIANFKAITPDNVTTSKESISSSMATSLKETISPNENDFVGSYSEIRRDRTRLNQQMESFCNAKIGLKYGVKFSGVDLIDILPPQELETALNAIQNAKTESETMYARAEADSRQKIAAAEKGVEIAKIKAEATALEIQTQGMIVGKLLYSGHFNNYLRHRRTEIIGDSRLTFVQKEN